MARTMMARLPWLFRLEFIGKKHSCRFRKNRRKNKSETLTSKFSKMISSIRFANRCIKDLQGLHVISIRQRGSDRAMVPGNSLCLGVLQIRIRVGAGGRCLDHNIFAYHLFVSSFSLRDRSIYTEILYQRIVSYPNNLSSFTSSNANQIESVATKRDSMPINCQLSFHFISFKSSNRTKHI